MAYATSSCPGSMGGTCFPRILLPYLGIPLSEVIPSAPRPRDSAKRFPLRTYTRESIGPTTHWIDFKEGPYVGRGLLFVLFSVLDAGWQTTAFWMIGAMSNDPCKLAFFTGFYKSIQSAGGATAWALDADNQPFMDLFIATWAIFAAGLVFMLPMMHMRVKESTQEITLVHQSECILLAVNQGLFCSICIEPASRV